MNRDSTARPVTTSKAGRFLRECVKHRGCLLLLPPSIVWFLVFKYFERIFSTSRFLSVFTNTLILSGYKLLFVFPVPILLATNAVSKRLGETGIW